MVVNEMKCTMCGKRFEVEVLDREDPRERNVHGYPVLCPNCNSRFVETIRTIRRVTRSAS